MKIRNVFVGGGLCVLVLITAGCQSFTDSGDAPRQASFFQNEVRGILELNCLTCHNTRSPSGGLDLSHKSGAMSRNGRGQPFLLPGNPDQSLVFSAISRPGTHPKLMPQRDLSLSDDDIGTLREWIEDGAYWPGGASGHLRPRPNPEVPQ